MPGDGHRTNSPQRVLEEFESPHSTSMPSDVAEARSFATPTRDSLYFYQLQRKPARIHLLPERKRGCPSRSYNLLYTGIGVPASQTLH